MTLPLMFTTTRWVAAGTAALLLSACGGGTDTVAEPTPTGSVPASATASPRAYTEFTASLVPTDTAEPLMLTGNPAPTTDTEEPLPVS